MVVLRKPVYGADFWALLRNATRFCGAGKCRFIMTVFQLALVVFFHGSESLAETPSEELAPRGDSVVDLLGYLLQVDFDQLVRRLGAEACRQRAAEIPQGEVESFLQDCEEITVREWKERSARITWNVESTSGDNNGFHFDGIFPRGSGASDSVSPYRSTTPSNIPLPYRDVVAEVLSHMESRIHLAWDELRENGPDVMKAWTELNHHRRHLGLAYGLSVALILVLVCGWWFRERTLWPLLSFVGLVVEVFLVGGLIWEKLVCSQVEEELAPARAKISARRTEILEPRWRVVVPPSAVPSQVIETVVPPSAVPSQVVETVVAPSSAPETASERGEGPNDMDLLCEQEILLRFFKK